MALVQKYPKHLFEKRPESLFDSIPLPQSDMFLVLSLSLQERISKWLVGFWVWFGSCFCLILKVFELIYVICFVLNYLDSFHKQNEVMKCLFCTWDCSGRGFSALRNITVSSPFSGKIQTSKWKTMQGHCFGAGLLVFLFSI